MSAATETKPATVDGQRAALDLLRQLEALNWNQNAPIKSRNAVKAALRAAANQPEREFDQFAAVLSNWLTAPILGFSIGLDEFEAQVWQRAARSNRAAWYSQRPTLEETGRRAPGVDSGLT